MYMKYLEKKCLSRTKKFFEIFERYPRIPHFWTFGPLFEHFPKNHRNRDPVHMKARARKYQTPKKSTRYCKTRRHNITPKSKNPVHSGFRPISIYVRAHTRIKIHTTGFRKENFFKISLLLNFVSLQEKFWKKFSQLVELARV